LPFWSAEGGCTVNKRKQRRYQGKGGENGAGKRKNLSLSGGGKDLGKKEEEEKKEGHLSPPPLGRKHGAGRKRPSMPIEEKKKRKEWAGVYITQLNCSRGKKSEGGGEET